MPAPKRGSTAALAALCTLEIPRIAAAADLNLFPNPALLAANVVVFLLLLYPTSVLLLRPLVRVLVERERRTQGALAEAAAQASEAAKLRGELEARLRASHAAAHARRAEIAAETEQQTRRLVESARSDASRTLAAVRESIAQELSDARSTLAQDVRVLAAEAASRILGRAL